MTNERKACATSVLIPLDYFPLINSFGLCETHNKESTQHVRQTDKDTNIIVLFVRRRSCQYQGAFFSPNTDSMRSASAPLHGRSSTERQEKVSFMYCALHTICGEKQKVLHTYGFCPGRYE